MNPRCVICGGPTHKWGRTSAGKTRFRCSQCKASHTRSNQTRARDFAAFLDFVTGKLTWANYGASARTMRRKYAPFWKLWPVSPLVDEVHHVVFVDGIYLSRKLVVLIACTDTHVVGWYVAKGETTYSWQALMSRIAAPDVVVCDGGPGIAKAVKTTWPTTRIQRCVFHAFSAVKRKTTTRPRTQAGVDLYNLAKSLLKITTGAQAVQWMKALSQWNTTYSQFLSEMTRLPTGQLVPTHQRLIQAKNILNTLARKGTLFTYLDPNLHQPHQPIPSTSNQIEGGINAQLRAVLRNHRGMRLDHQVKTVLWWCYLHTEFPKTPAQILKETITDEQIAQLFEDAAHRARAQTQIEQWGTAVNWTDFHHNGIWHQTY